MESPLKNIRVADFTWVWAGPYSTMFMAALGAEVIKIENPDHLDIGRALFPFAYADPQVHQQYLRWLGIPEQERGPFAHGGPSSNQCGYFNRLNHGKKSVTLNLKNLRDVETAKELIPLCDVVAENYSPRVMKGLGLGYDALRMVKPDIIYLAMSGFGAYGPDSHHVMYGEGQVTLSGLSSLTGYPGGEPLPTPIPYPDPVASMHGIIALMAALRHRNRTGEGQYIDLSQWESALSLLPEGILEYTINHRLPRRTGNKDPYMAPHDCYPCRGDDQWVAIAVGSDEEWKALCQAMGRLDLALDGRFKTLQLRKQNEAALDSIITNWTHQYTPYEVTEKLQGLEVAATPVLNNAQVVNEPHLNERGFFVEVDHPETGPRKHPWLPFRFDHEPVPARRAPLLGEHNTEVFHELLGHLERED